MNRNIDEFARRYFANPARNPDLPVQQMFGRVVKRADFEKLRSEQPDWYELGDGLHNISGRNQDGSPFSYKLAVRKTPGEWFFLAYDMTQTMRGEEQFTRAIYLSVVVFTLLSFVVGLWAAPPHESGERPQDSGGRTLRIATAAELQTVLENARARWSAAEASGRSGH